MVNEVAPRPHNSGHYTIEAVPQMSQYKAQLYAILDLPVPKKLIPQVSSSIMVNILGGATITSHHKLSALARETFDDKMYAYLHLYGKESKPGRKIGHVTLTGSCPIQELERLAEPFLKLADEIRAERIKADTKPLRPQNAPASETANGVQKSTAAVAVQSKISGSQVVVNPDANKVEEAPLVLVTMGSDSDLPVLGAGLDILDKFKVPYTTRISSAHRTAKFMMQLAEEAAGKGIKVIIAAAGGAAHLPGMVSSETPLPVIGVPVKASCLDGMDSLLSIVQMPRGVPTATVGINNSTNAALLAIRILGTSIPRYQEQMVKYQQDMTDTVLEKDSNMEKIGGQQYLAKMRASSK
jgi:phosphoribosylaminoimidazole carboxylase